MRRLRIRPPTRRIALAALAAVLVACGGTGPAGDAAPDADAPGRGDTPRAPASAPVHDAIAYVAAGGDEIRLIDPDGSGDRSLWSHGRADPHDVYDVWSLAWNPGATELAFASTHENDCSLNHVDVFAVAADGTTSRRVTQAPACPDLSDWPTGTVRVPVENHGLDSFDGFLYFQGAPRAQPVNLPPGGSTVVTFEDVADFGSGDAHLQVGAIVHGANREYAFATAVDVRAGGTVTTGVAGAYRPAASWEARAPTWSPDGERVAHVLNFGTLWQMPAAPPAGDFGTGLLADGVDMPNFVTRLAWGPTAETADTLLYAATEVFEATQIRRVREGAADAGEILLSFEATESVLGLAWLPDGSGFVYALTEGAYFGEERAANLFVHDLSDATSERLTSFVGEFAGRLAVSPDGARIAFERADELAPDSTDLLAPDLWTVARDGSGAALLVEGGAAPAWSR